VSRRTEAWDEAVDSFGIEPGPRQRPDPVHWLWYALWAPLPERYRAWVLYDVTCSTWVFRHLARVLIIATVPVAVVVIFLPGPLHVRVLTALVAGLGGFLFAAVWVNEATEHRLIRAGWRAGLGPELRERRSEIAAWMASVRRL
jgi:hypothetical protein